MDYASQKGTQRTEASSTTGGKVWLSPSWRIDPVPRSFQGKLRGEGNEGQESRREGCCEARVSIYS